MTDTTVLTVYQIFLLAWYSFLHSESLSVRNNNLWTESEVVTADGHILTALGCYCTAVRQQGGMGGGRAVPRLNITLGSCTGKQNSFVLQQFFLYHNLTVKVRK